MLIILVAVAAFLATLLGGLFALQLKDRLHLILGFSAGAVVGVAFFDLIPEALELGNKFYPISTTVSMMALGFAVYLVVDRLILHHGHEAENQQKIGSFGAGTLSFHSLLDGIGIGLAFKVSPTLGIIMAVAVLTHDFSDGINTVNFVLKNKGTQTKAVRWLLVDSFAPALGIMMTLFFSIPEEKLGLLLALFSGFFLYIGASDLVPESHHTHPVRWTTIATLLGMGAFFTIIRIVN